MKKITFIAFLFMVLVTGITNAQNVGINNTNPQTTLDVKGGIATRAVTLTPFANAVNIPENSSFVEVGPGTAAVTCIAPSFIDGQRLVILNKGGYNNFFNGTIIPPNQSREFICRNPGGWTLLSGATANESWMLKGNAGTDTSVNFMGTTDNKPLLFKVHNQTAGMLDAEYRNTVFGPMAFSKFKTNVYAGENVAIGANALANDTIGYGNSAIGANSMELTASAGNQNTAVGSYTLKKNLGNQNTALGSNAMEYHTSGNRNTAVGAYAYSNKFNGTGNTAIGYFSMAPNISRYNYGNYNTAIGMFSLRESKGSGAVAIGYQASFSDTAAEGIVAIGRAALYSNNNKIGNLAIGDSALFNNGIGATSFIQATNNVAIGSKALKTNTIGYNNVAIGKHSLVNNTVGINNIAIGTDALFSNQANSRNIAIGDSSMYSTGELTFPEPILSEKSVDNIVLGRKSLYRGHKVFKNISIGNYTNYNGEWAERNVTIGDSAMFYNYEGTDNVAIGNNSMNGGPNASNNYSGGNVAIGSFSLYNNGDPYFNSGLNTAIGYYSGYNNHGNAFNERSGNVFLGSLSGFFAQSANKLYIENTNADSLSALIYGDFAADSLLLNAKTVVRNNAVVKGFTKLGGYGTDVPSIKMKKLTVTNGAAGAITIVAHGLTQSKILSVSVFVNATTSNDIAPRSTYAGFEYDYYVSSSSIVIKNITGNDTFIAGRPVRILITYEE
jgi:trimeric autotransporter adhesin